MKQACYKAVTRLRLRARNPEAGGYAHDSIALNGWIRKGTHEVFINEARRGDSHDKYFGVSVDWVLSEWELYYRIHSVSVTLLIWFAYMTHSQLG